MDLKFFKRVPLQKLQTPKSGYELIENHYWSVVDGDALIFTFGGGYAPQCNENESLAKLVTNKLFPGAEVKLIPAAYIKSRG